MSDTPAQPTAKKGRRGSFFAVVLLVGLAIVLAGVFPFRQLIAQERLVDNTREKLDALERKLAELEARGGAPDASAH